MAPTGIVPPSMRATNAFRISDDVITGEQMLMRVRASVMRWPMSSLICAPRAGENMARTMNGWS